MLNIGPIVLQFSQFYMKNVMCSTERLCSPLPNIILRESPGGPGKNDPIAPLLALSWGTNCKPLAYPLMLKCPYVTQNVDNHK